MIRRLVWFVSGAVAGVLGAGYAKRKARAAAEELAPAAVARRAAGRLRDAVDEGRRAARTREAELKAQLGGSAHSLADDLADGDTVLVDGRRVEPGQVIVLRQVDDPLAARTSRLRRAAARRAERRRRSA
ncbi:MAG: hypothetical protein ACKOAZ_04005 [Ilumatobacteraceae bacterium]